MGRDPPRAPRDGGSKIKELVQWGGPSRLNPFVAAAVAAALIGVPRVGAAQDTTAQKGTQATLEELAAYATPAVVLLDVRTPTSSRQGSGFIVSASGRILTNYHVVRDARNVRVKLSSGDVYDEVQILAEDERRDIAVLQVPGFDLPALPLGNSDSVRIGAAVVLIGSPHGLENTVSTGIVSGRRQEEEGYKLLQVSAPASRGSSGGAVLSINGDVVGIAVSQLEAGQNLNFAVPINYARGMLDHLPSSPVRVLRATTRASDASPEEKTATRSESVNQGLAYRLEGFQGYRIETRTTLDHSRERRTRVTYRIIETVGDAAPQLERYLESETTTRTEPFGTIQTLRRERSRTVVELTRLHPVSARGEVTSWTETGWATATYDMRFDGGHVLGVINDTSEARSKEIDMDLPAGIILHDVRELAFALLDSEQLVGRSVEFTTFDPRTAEVLHDRYDVLDQASVKVGDQTYDALQVNLATGLDNETLFFRSESPRIFLRRVRADSGEVEEMTAVQYFAGKEGG
jgi:S1-C subfamily serine protease